jgi:cell wall-associated NlpC family hydrolase
VGRRFPSGFDCSGFVMYVYAQVGVSLPHSSYSQYGTASRSRATSSSPATSSSSTGSGTSGIYVGGGSFIHAPHTGDVVQDLSR